MACNVITTVFVDNLSYGYIGIRADAVKVGKDSGSDASKNLRKAFAAMFAVYHDSVIGSYYGERAVIIQYPISCTSWPPRQGRPTKDMLSRIPKTRPETPYLPTI